MERSESGTNNAGSNEDNDKSAKNPGPRSEHIKVSEVQSEHNSEDELPPPLPPRRANPQVTDVLSSSLGSLPRPNTSLRPPLQSNPTIAVSLTDIHAQTFQDGSQGTYALSSEKPHYKTSPRVHSSLGRHPSRNFSDADESGSLRSYAPTIVSRLDEGNAVLGVRR